jgi:hypothetical protein
MKSRLMVVGLLLGVSVCAWGQASTAQINGTVRDSSSAPVPGAEIRVIQTDTGLNRSVTSQSDGGYVFSNLPVGPYRLEVTREGFSKYVQAGLVLEVSGNPVVDVALQVGTVTESVQVEAQANLVETQTSGVGQLVDNQRILELPLNGRQPTELIFLSGIATSANATTATQPLGSGVNSGIRNYPTTSIAVAGGIANGITYTLDGGSHNDPFNNLNLPLPFPDALQEFKVETSALPAQYGHHSAAAVNAVTRSGTNVFHGAAFEFIRNSATNARNAFAATQDGLKRNQFGGVFGGPIRPNKLFVFLGLQTTLQRVAPTAFVGFVPTAQMLAGDFTTIASAQCNSAGRSVNLAAPFVDNRIAPSLLSPPALRILGLKGFPTSTDPCGQVAFGRRTNSNEYLGTGRMDYQKSDKHSILGRYLGAHFFQPTDADPNNLLSGNAATLDFLVQSLVLGDTYSFGANTVSNFRVTVNRTRIPKDPVPLFDASQVGINTYVGVPNLLRIGTTGGFNLGSTASTPSYFNALAYQFTEDLSVVKGRHQLGFGGTFLHSILNAVSGVQAPGAFTFSGQVTGLGLADFMIGKAASYGQGTPNQIYIRQNYIGLYAQDTWRAASRFTVSYGVRWDPYLPAYSKPGWIYNLDPAKYAQGVRSNQFTNAPAGLVYPGDPGYPGKSVAFRRWQNLAPRVGLAWDPNGDGRTSIRAAYGIFFDLPALNMYQVFGFSSPFGNTTSVNFPSDFANPWSGIPGGNPFPIPAANKNSNYVAFGTYENFLLNFKTPNSQQWNISLQKQIGTDWLLQANYVGNMFTHLVGGNQGNPGVYIPGSCVINGVSTNPCSTAGNVNFRRSLYLQNPTQGQYFGIIHQLDAGGTATYNALVLSVQKRSSKGYSLQAVYTWSHCISDLASLELGGGGQLFMIPDNRAADRSNCPGSDRRHNFNLSSVYEAPRFNNSALRIVASGWQLSGILRLTTGPYLNVLSGLDQALTGQTAYERPNQVLANPYYPNRTLSNYLNPAAFAQPVAGTYGNLGDYSILGPGAITLNMGLTRIVKLSEKYSMQFRFESFNLPNHLNPGSPTGISGAAGVTTPTVALNNPQFGRILSADDPRILQGAIKFVF